MVFSEALTIFLKNWCLILASLQVWHFLQTSRGNQWPRAGVPASPPIRLPAPPTAIPRPAQITRPYVCPGPQIFLHEVFPTQPPGWLELSHASPSPQSPWTPAQGPSEPRDTCSVPVWTGGRPLCHHWHGGRPLEKSPNQMLGRRVPRPWLPGLIGAHIPSHYHLKKGRGHFGSPGI